MTRLRASPAVAALSGDVASVIRTTWPLLILVAVVGAAFVAVVPPGLPYDEPAHWLNVLFYLDHAAMPVIGEPGTSYEAQMGPVAYAVYAVATAPLRLVAGEQAAFFGARALGVVVHLAVTCTMAALTARVLRPRSGVALVVVAAVGLNPMLLAIATSVQNDTLALLLAVAALLIADRVRCRGIGDAVLAGVLIGLTVLTKVTMWPVAVGIGLMLLWRRHLLAAVLATATALIVAGWWFLRNVLLYGDITARAAVAAAGYDFPALADPGIIGLARSAMTYMWLPTEYVRNTVVAPAPIDGVVIGLTVAAAVGAVLLMRRHARPAVLLATLAGIAVIAVSAWVVTATTLQALAFRTAYACLPFVFACVGALAYLGRRRVTAVLATALLVVDIWFLVGVATSASANGRAWLGG